MPQLSSDDRGIVVSSPRKIDLPSRYSVSMSSDLALWASKAIGSTRGVPVPDVRQQTTYTCGPAVVSAVLRYFGINVPEEQLAEEAHTIEAVGTNVEDMVRVLLAHGVAVDERSDLTLPEMASLIESGSLVIVALQAWKDAPPEGGYEEEWDSGHYVIPVEIGKDEILFEDPAVAGRRAYLSTDEFLSRWHTMDSDGLYPAGFGLVVSGESLDTIESVKSFPLPIPMG
jgi:predicted double-glycine peptidase